MNPAVSGSGFDSLDLTVVLNGVQVENLVFTTVQSAENFFSDDVLNLKSGASGTNTLSLTFTLNDDPAGDGFAVNTLVYTSSAPEPSTWILLMLTAFSLWLVRVFQAARVRVRLSKLVL